MNLGQLIIISISLSMDAFSLAIIYGTVGLEKKMTNLLSLMVGTFHFFMPILGSVVGIFLLESFIPNPDLLIGIIFTILACEMLFGIKDLDNSKANITGIYQALLFAFSVSIDSFSMGIGLGLHEENIILCGLLFSVFSFLFTKLGLDFGRKLTIKFGKIANIVGSIILLILGIKYLIFNV